MPTTSTLEIDINQLKKDCAEAFKETFNDIQAYCQEVITLLQNENKTLKTALKKQKTALKTQQRDLQAAQQSLKQKSSKVLEAKAAKLTASIAALTQDITNIETQITLFSDQAAEVKAIKAKEKSRQATHKAFDENYHPPKASVQSVITDTLNPDKAKKASKQAIVDSVKEAIQSAMQASHEPLVAGQKAPEFTVDAADGSQIHLSDFVGKKVVLYFYPKDDTPGCTQEANDFMDRIDSFKANNTVILGVSRDSHASHQKFKDKYAIHYTLLADTDETICQLYDVIKPKNMYGKTVRGIERSTFLIDESGKLQHIWRKVKVSGHADKVLEAVSENTQLQIPSL